MTYQNFPLKENSVALLAKPAKNGALRRIRIRLNQYLYRNRTNAPYISGDSIASLTDYYVYGRDGQEELDKLKLENAKSVFLNSDKLVDFLKDLTQVSSKKIILVTGNSDYNFVNKPDLPKSIKAWLCQNNGMIKQKNVFTLPIGIENIKLGRLGLPKWYKPSNNIKIEDKILVPPMSPTNIQRKVAVDFASKNPEYFDVYLDYLHEREYFELTRKYKFILCCEGNGFENHRIWETLYQGSFPVLISSTWSRSLEYLSLPILYVNSLDELSPERLREFLNLNLDFNPSECKPLWTPYWRDFIENGTFPNKNL